jgi:hypothetical protein
MKRRRTHLVDRLRVYGDGLRRVLRPVSMRERTGRRTGGVALRVREPVREVDLALVRLRRPLALYEGCRSV